METSKGNLYLAHSVMRFIGSTGTNCGFKDHNPSATTEWEFCTLQDLYRGADLLSQGMDEEQVDKKLWDDACKEQDLSGTRFYQNIHCCTACAFAILIGHTNNKHLARSMMALAQARNNALLLVSERSTKLPLVVANIPLNIRATDIWSLLKVDLTTR